MRWFGWMLARAEEIGKIVHELELGGVRHIEGYEAILRRRALDPRTMNCITPAAQAVLWRLAAPVRVWGFPQGLLRTNQVPLIRIFQNLCG
jgi:hypothetical protein